MEPKPPSLSFFAASRETFATPMHHSNRLWLILGALLAGVLYFAAAEIQSTHLNTNLKAHDQGAMLNYAKRLSDNHLQYVGPRNRMPLYPILQSFVYRPDMTTEQFFQRAKLANIVLSIAVLGVVYLLFRKWFPLHHTINVILVTAYGVYALKAPYVAAELLFYLLLFICFLLTLRMLDKPSLGIALALGAMLAIAHYTKASAPVAVAIFLFCYGLRIAFPALVGERDPTPAAAPEPSDTASQSTRQSSAALARHSEAKPARLFLIRAIYGAMVLATFLAILYPYLRKSNERYGRYFYNVNSTIYMWCDSAPEWKAFSLKYDDRHRFPSDAGEELPTARRYLAMHTPGQIVGRIARGFGRMTTEVFHSFWYTPFLILYAAAGLYAAIRSRRLVAADFRRFRLLALFCLLFFGSYFGLYCWWAVLARSQRFVLSLYFPALFILSYIYNRYADRASITITGTSRPLRHVVDWSVTCLALINVIVTLLWTASSVDGGSTM